MYCGTLDRDCHTGMEMLNQVIDEGRSWPFEELLDLQGFRAYFLSHHAFVVREPQGGEGAYEVLGVFYVKPNFPGRCAHICNGGFVTHLAHRRRGVGRLMGLAFRRLAADLGYRAAFFNLVFASNAASAGLWESLGPTAGFRRLATVPRAARLRGLPGLQDAHQVYCDLTEPFDLNAALCKKNQKESVSAVDMGGEESQVVEPAADGKMIRPLPPSLLPSFPVVLLLGVVVYRVFLPAACCQEPLLITKKKKNIIIQL